MNSISAEKSVPVSERYGNSPGTYNRNSVTIPDYVEDEEEEEEIEVP